MAVTTSHIQFVFLNRKMEQEEVNEIFCIVNLNAQNVFI